MAVAGKYLRELLLHWPFSLCANCARTQDAPRAVGDLIKSVLQGQSFFEL